MQNGGAAPAPGSFEAFQLKKQQDEFQAFLDNKRKAEMAQFAATAGSTLASSSMNRRAPKHTKEDIKNEMKSFVDEHQHNSSADIKKDLHDFVQEGHTKAEVKAIIHNNPELKKVLVKDVLVKEKIAIAEAAGKKVNANDIKGFDMDAENENLASLNLDEDDLVDDIFDEDEEL